MSASSCLIAAPEICVNLVADFPIWEVLASVAVTGLVTFVTIRWSVRAARRETMIAIAASREAEERERQERVEAAAEESRREEARMRIALAESISRSAHDLRALLDIDPDEPRRVAAESLWRALRVPFRASALTDAFEVYEYADLRIASAMRKRVAPPAGEEFVQYLLRREFVRDIELALENWTVNGSLPSSVTNELTDLRAERDERETADRERLVAALISARDAPEPPVEGNIWAADEDDSAAT